MDEKRSNHHITVTKITIAGETNYIMIKWFTSSFEMSLLNLQGLHWHGRFSSRRLNGFSKNLHVGPSEYFKRVYQALSKLNEDYIYEFKDGFFLWKRRTDSSVLLEGFLPMEETQDITNSTAINDFIEILLAMNTTLKNKVTVLKSKYNIIRTDYHRCIKDTEEFLNLKMDMERSLCDKFLGLMSMKKTKLEDLDKLKNSKIRGIS